MRPRRGFIWFAIVVVVAAGVWWMWGRDSRRQLGGGIASPDSAHRAEPAEPSRERPGPPLVPAAVIAESRPTQWLNSGYVSSRACLECHPREHATWEASYHRRMTQVASPQTALPSFDGVELSSHGRSFRLHVDAQQQLWAEMLDLDEPSPQGPEWFPIVLSTGFHHMQIFWYAVGQGRLLGQFPLVYLREEQRWAPRESVFLWPPVDEYFGRSETGRWNETCIACHATGGLPRVSREHGVDSLVAEFGIACEACHGPGEAHVRLRRTAASGGAGPAAPARPPAAPDASRAAAEGDPIVNPARLSPRRAAQVCGQCHSAHGLYKRDQASFNAEGARFRPGDDLDSIICVFRDDEASRAAMRADDGSVDVEAIMREAFWSDGMIRIAGREYNGLIESACHQRGELTCVSCHVLHQHEDDRREPLDWANDLLTPGHDGDQACLQCHAPSYREPSHTHHASAGAGSRCQNCHMPHTTYGLLKAIRSHQISSPRVATSLETGRPNACNQCHLDRSLEWAAEHLEAWYGQERPELNEEQRTIAASLLWTTTGDAGQRALMAWSLGWEAAHEASGTAWLAPPLIVLLEDPYDAVRFIAARSLRRLPGFQDWEYDFVASTDDRARAVAEAWERWRAQPPVAEHPALLIGPQGTLDQERLDQLRSRRDDRPVKLSE